MKANKGVKVIKRGERKSSDSAEQRHEGAEKTAREVTRAIKRTVSGWVNEHRQKREEESATKFEQLFAEAA